MSYKHEIDVEADCELQGRAVGFTVRFIEVENDEEEKWEMAGGLGFYENPERIFQTQTLVAKRDLAARRRHWERQPAVEVRKCWEGLVGEAP